MISPVIAGAGLSGRVMNKRHSKLTAQEPVSEDNLRAAARLIQSVERSLKQPHAIAANAPTAKQLVKLAKRLRDVRKSRVRFLDQDLFGEPAWDMVLALYIAHIEQYRLKVTDLVHESLASSSTALRWIIRLQKIGLIVRRENPMDHRSFYLEMPDDGVIKVTALLENAWVNYFAKD